MKKIIFILFFFNSILITAQNYAQWKQINKGLLYVGANGNDTVFYKKIGDIFYFNTDSVCLVPDKFPYFIAGEKELKRIIYENFNFDAYPAEIFTNSVSGTIVVYFIVTKKGNIKNVGIWRSFIEEVNSELIELIYNIPGWEAGCYNGKKVNSFFMLPINLFNP